MSVPAHKPCSISHLSYFQIKKTSISYLLSDCSTLTNHCICATNFEYLHKPDHLLQCFSKRKCFHCQRYKCMNKDHDTVTATTKLILIAAALGKFEILKFLCQSGCSLEAKSGIFELRPLHLSIVHGHFNIFCYLLTQKVDVNAAILSHGTTYSPLMLAVIYKQEDMVRHLLMARDTNVAYRNSLLQSPVMFAVQNNSLELINLLLSAEDNRAVKRKATDSRHRVRVRKRSHHPGALLEALKQGKFIRILEASSRVSKLTLKAPNKNCCRHFKFFLLSFEENKA